MTARRPDLVLGAAVGYSYQQVRPFVQSLRATEFRGDISLLVAADLPRPDREALAGFGVKMVPVHRWVHWVPRSFSRRRFSRRLRPLHRLTGRLLGRLPGSVGSAVRRNYVTLFNHVALARYAYYLGFLLRRPRAYRYVLLSDVRDVLFQAEPFTRPPAAPVVCALETDLVRIGTQSGNASWFQSCFGEAGLAAFADRRVSCSGTTLGTAEGVIAYLRQMVDILAVLVHRTLGCDGLDQAVHNFLLWDGRLPGASTVENNQGPVLTMHGERPERFRIDRGFARAEDGNVIPILHQYDRHPDLNLAAVRTFAKC